MSGHNKECYIFTNKLRIIINSWFLQDNYLVFLIHNIKFSNYNTYSYVCTYILIYSKYFFGCERIHNVTKFLGKVFLIFFCKNSPSLLNVEQSPSINIRPKQRSHQNMSYIEITLFALPPGLVLAHISEYCLKIGVYNQQYHYLYLVFSSKPILGNYKQRNSWKWQTKNTSTQKIEMKTKLAFLAIFYMNYKKSFLSKK